MRALVQRVTEASVSVGDEPVAAIGPGLLVLLGVTHEDDASVADRLADKIAKLRVFADADGRMNEPLGDREVLVISQFTLYGTRARAPARATSPPPGRSTPSRSTRAWPTRSAPPADGSARTCASRSSTTGPSRCSSSSEPGSGRSA